MMKPTVRVAAASIAALALALAALAALSRDEQRTAPESSAGSGPPQLPAARLADVDERPQREGAPAPERVPLSPRELVTLAGVPASERELDRMIDQVGVGFAAPEGAVGPAHVPGGESAFEALLDALTDEAAEAFTDEQWVLFEEEAARIARLRTFRELYLAGCLLYRSEAPWHDHGLDQSCTCTAPELPEVQDLRELRAQADQHLRTFVLGEPASWLVPFLATQDPGDSR